MQKIKTIYFIFALITFIIFGFSLLIPQIIPSWEIVQKIIIEIIYVFNLALVYIIIRRTQKFSFTRFSKKIAITLTSFTTLFLAFSILFLFAVTSLGFGQGFMGATLEKEYNFPEYNTTIYIYNAGFLDPATAIKLRKGWLPIMKDIKFIGGYAASETKVLLKENIIQLSFQDTTFNISLKTSNLITE